MSKFFRAGASDSESSDSESSDFGGGTVLQPTRPTATKTMPSMAWMSDSEEETKRIVYSAKDKRYRELKDIIRQLRNSKKIKDVNKTLSMFEELCRAFQKARSVIDKEGGFIPRFYIRYLAELEDYVIRSWEEKKEKNREGQEEEKSQDSRKSMMSKQNSRALTTLRQKLRKYMKDFETEVVKYREEPDPEGYSSGEATYVAGEESSESSEEEEDEADAYLKKTGTAPKDKEPAMDEGDSDLEWASSGDDDSTESELEDLDLEGKKMEDLRKFFLKKDYKEGKSEEDKNRKKTLRKKREEEKRLREEDEDEGWKTVRGQTVMERPKMFDKDAEITHKAVLEKLAEILKSRGKKRADRCEMVELLTELLKIAEAHNLGAAMSVKIKMMIVAGMLEYGVKILDCMKYESWQSAIAVMQEILTLLNENHQVQCVSALPEEEENVQDTNRPMYVTGSLLALLERLDDEFTKILQVADCHSTDYVQKLKGETEVCSLIENLQMYMERQEYGDKELCQIYIRRIEHVYYKLDWKTGEVGSAAPVEGGSGELMQRLCEFIYARDTATKSRLRERALFCHVYHRALHGHWHQARDLMLMSKLQGTIDHSDIPNQILYNRAVCQLGLCAFRHGLIKEAHVALSDIQNSGRAKELLAQGLSMRGNQERTPEQEKLERQRQVPYHLHINLELLECVYLICSMLLEIPQMPTRDQEMRRKMLSRSFHYQLKQSERFSLVGPPENTREHVVATSKALLNGDWRAATQFIVNDKMNAKVWNLFYGSERVKQMVVRRIQEESLRTYLLTYSSVYKTLSLKTLAEMFELEKKAVHALISKMIIEEQLSATLDEPAECLVIHRVEPSRLQLLALQLTEKLNYLAESNEQILDPRSGGQGYVSQHRPAATHWFAQRQHGGGGGHEFSKYGRRQPKY